jgi:hypothetical protein
VDFIVCLLFGVHILSKQTGGFTRTTTYPSIVEPGILCAAKGLNRSLSVGINRPNKRYEQTLLSITIEYQSVPHTLSDMFRGGLPIPLSDLFLPLRT